MLLSWPHGLGDSVQGTVVLRHIHHYYPQWRIDCEIKHGHTVFHRLARRTYLMGTAPTHGKYDLVRALSWLDPDQSYADSPSTKAERCLREVFHLQPIEELCRYQITPDRRARARARKFARELGGPFALIHHEGNSAANAKYMTARTMRAVVAEIRAAGLIPVLLDWDYRSELLGEPGVVNAPAGHWLWGGEHGTGDGATIAALASLSRLNIGIDSGPGHIFGAVDTPAIITWRHHHPVNYYCLAPNVLHVLRRGHEKYIRGDRAAGLEYFHRRYRHVEIDVYRLDLPGIVKQEIARADSQKL
jgi:ADP-heptose:LPS heptosyltransferase